MGDVLACIERRRLNSYTRSPLRLFPKRKLSVGRDHGLAGDCFLPEIARRHATQRRATNSILNGGHTEFALAAQGWRIMIRGKQLHHAAGKVGQRVLDQ